MTSMTMFAPSLSTGFKLQIAGCAVHKKRKLKRCMKLKGLSFS